MEKLKIVIPKGRLNKKVLTLLNNAGLGIDTDERCYIPRVEARGIEAKIMKPQNIPQLVEVGSHDMGFTGLDWIMETGAEVEEVMDLGFNGVSIVAAVPDSLSEKELYSRKIVVASEYREIATKYLEEKGFDYYLIRTFGATEEFPPDDADMIIDNMSTGRTLEEHNLKIIDGILISTTRMIVNKESLENAAKKARIDELVMLMKSVLDAEERVMLEMNVTAGKLDALVADLPCMRAPTVAPLFNDDAYAVKIAVKKKESAALIPKLKAMGATDILEYNFQEGGIMTARVKQRLNPATVGWEGKIPFVNDTNGAANSVINNVIKEKVRRLSAYSVPQVFEGIKLNQNESPYDVPLEVKKKIWNGLRTKQWNRYPQSDSEGLVDALSRYTGFPVGGILVGNSSNELIQTVIGACCCAGDAIITVSPTFSVYKRVADTLEAETAEVELNEDFTFNVEALLEMARKKKRAKIMLLASPNNPTGTVMSLADVEKLAQKLTFLLVLDEAYLEFHGQSAQGLISKYPNIIVLRTFSKALQGAGIRLGYLLAEEQMVAELEKAKLPFSVGIFQQAAGEVFLENLDWLEENTGKIISERERLFEFLVSLRGVEPVRSRANFILFGSCGVEASALFQRLRERGVLVRFFGDVSSDLDSPPASGGSPRGLPAGQGAAFPPPAWRASGPPKCTALGELRCLVHTLPQDVSGNASSDTSIDASGGVSGGGPLKEMLRVTVGTRDENDFFMETLRAVLDESLPKDAITATPPGLRLECGGETLKALLFDMDGVLIDVSESYVGAIKKTVEYFSKSSCPVELIEETRERGGLNNDWDLTEFILESRGVEVSRDKIVSCFQEFYVGGNWDGLIVNEKSLVSVPLLQRVCGDYITGIVTGRPEDEALYTLRRFGLEGFFDVVVTMKDVPEGRGKPDPLGLRIALERLGVTEGFYIGDTVDDMRAATAAGLIGLGVSGNRKTGLLSNEGAKVVFPTTDKALTYLNKLNKNQFETKIIYPQSAMPCNTGVQGEPPLAPAA